VYLRAKNKSTQWDLKIVLVNRHFMKKVQEEHPHLRGKLYKLRKGKEEEIKQEIRDI